SPCLLAMMVETPLDAQLALVPLSLSNVFARRLARAVAGAIATICALAFLLRLGNPSDFVFFVDFEQSIWVTIVAVLGSYIATRWAAERIFEHRLHVGSELDQRTLIARTLVRGVDGWAVSLVLAGIMSTSAAGGLIVVVGRYIANARYPDH